MNGHISVQYTETFENSLNDSIDYLSQCDEIHRVVEGVESLLNAFEENVTQNPLMYSRCPELVSLGVANIREYKKSGFRLLYEVTDNNTVYGLILLRQRQDISMALTDYCIIYK